MHKLMIIACDGLNSKPVKKYHLKHLQLARMYDIDKVGNISPEIWASYLTGKIPKEHGILGGWSNNVKYVNLERKLEHIFLEFAKKPIPVMFPFLDKQWREYIGVEISLKRIYQSNIYAYYKALENIDKDWDMMLVCFMFIDNLDHYKGLTKERYLFLDHLAGSLIEIGNPRIAMILGDHGTNHSNPAYCSCSLDIDLELEKATDVYSAVKQIMKMRIRKREGKRGIKKKTIIAKLKKLGYLIET